MNAFNHTDTILLTNYHFDNDKLISRLQPMTPDVWLKYVEKREDCDSEYVVPLSAADFWQIVVSQPGHCAETITFDKKGAFHDAVRFVKGLKV